MATKKYKVIYASDIELLEKKVNQHIGYGWTLQGGVSISHSAGAYGTVYYAQAMFNEGYVD